MAKVRVGIVGAGLIARDHANTLRRNRQVGGLSVFDADEARARKLAAEFGAEAEPTLDALVGRCDLIWVCTPPFAHLEPVEAACRAGRAVFCEKPLAHNIGGAQAIRDAVRRAKTPFFMGQSGRFTPPFILLKSLVDRGAVGTPTLVWSTRLGWLDPKTAPPWRMTDEGSGGAVVELGVHELDYINWVGGPLKSVYARGSSATLAPGRFQDSVEAVGSLRSGASAQLTLSWAEPRYLWQRGVRGTEGSLFYDDSRYADILLHRPAREPKVFSVREKNWLDPQTKENLSLRDQARAVLTALKRGDPPPVTIDDGFDAVQAAMAIRESSRRGVVVNVR